MNSIKIEKAAIDELKRTIRLHDKMDEFLQCDDKTPCWDGDICIYNDESLRSENILYRIPTQIKGKKDKVLLKRKCISYPVEYKNLRNYRNDGGVCYFVIIISDDGMKNSIFYNALTPIKLESILKNTEGKKPEQHKNIALTRLERNDKNELYKLLLQFGHDSKEQGVGELVRKAISIEDMDKIDSIRVTTFESSEYDAIKKMESAEACVFGYISGADVWLPMSYELQRSMKLQSFVKVDKNFGVDGVNYYNSFAIGKNSKKENIIKLSENLSINIGKNTLTFNPVSELETLIKDIYFIQAMKTGKKLCVDGKGFCEYGDTNFTEEIERATKDFSLVYMASIKLNVAIDKRVESFDEDDWKSVNQLVNLYQKKIKPKEETACYIWWWEKKVIPFFIAKDENNDIVVENIFYMKKFQIVISIENEIFPMPGFILIKRDTWEKLYDINEEVILDSIEQADFNKETEGNYSLLLIEILAAYDKTSNEKYFDYAKIISDKLLEVSPESIYWKINKLQLLKRKRKLSEFELQELEEIEKNTDDEMIRCAANILLNNKRIAQKGIDAMQKQTKETFINYPIYNLL